MTIPDTRRWLLAGSMTAAAFCLVLGHMWNTPSTLPADQYVGEVSVGHGRFLAATLLTSIAALLMMPAGYGVGRLVQHHSPRLATIGTSLVAVGAAGLAVGVSIVGFTMGMLTAHDTALAEKVYDIASRDTFVGIPFDLAPLFSIGLLVLAVALIRTRAVPLWQPILLIVAVIAAFGAPAGGIAGAAGHTPLAIALVALAIPLWRNARADAMQTDPVAVAA